MSQEGEVLDNTQVWDISWEADGNYAEGKLYLEENGLARIIVDKPDAMFFYEPADLSFTWKINDKELILNRLDMDFSLKYQIVDRTNSSIKMRYANDLIVKLKK